MVKGTKRASPGAEEKKSPLEDVELNAEDAKKLEDVSKLQARVELAMERDNLVRLRDVYDKRRSVFKSISNFWPVAFLNHPIVSVFIQHNADQTALSYLEDVWVERSSVDHRCFTIEMHFKENNFFSDTVLKKEYKYIAPPGAENDKPDENGITETMMDFTWERDVQPTAATIQWKDATNALTKLYPRDTVADDEEPADPGSFFTFFEVGPDPFDIGSTIANEIFPEAISYFLNKPGEDSDSEDEDSMDEDDEEEIDLEKPRKKKQRV